MSTAQSVQFIIFQFWDGAYLQRHLLPPHQLTTESSAWLDNQVVLPQAYVTGWGETKRALLSWRLSLVPGPLKSLQMLDLWKTGGFEFSLLAVKATEHPYQIQLRFFFLVVHTDNVSIQISFHLHQKSPNQGVRWAVPLTIFWSSIMSELSRKPWTSSR